MGGHGRAIAAVAMVAYLARPKAKPGKQRAKPTGDRRIG